MDWQSLPESQNLDDRRAEPIPLWYRLGLSASPQDTFGGMVQDMRNPFTRRAPSFEDGRIPAPRNPSSLELSAGLNDIQTPKGGDSSVDYAEMVRRLMGSVR